MILGIYYPKGHREESQMRKIIGLGILCMALGLFVALLVRDRIAIFFVMLVLSLAGYACLRDD